MKRETTFYNRTATALVVGLGLTFGAAALSVSATASTESDRAAYLERQEQQIMKAEEMIEQQPDSEEPAMADLKRAWQQVEHDLSLIKDSAAEDWQDAKQAFEETWTGFQEEWDEMTAE